MDDGTPPSFLGHGLPKRAPDTSSASSSQRPGGWIIGGSALALLGITGALVVIPTLFAQRPPIDLQAVPTMSAEEQVAADRAIAGGGGAIPGHIVSGELCAAVNAFFAAGGETGSIDPMPAETMAAIDALAAVESPSRPTYEQFASMTHDPTSVPTPEDAQRINTNFATAIQVDYTTCL